MSGDIRSTAPAAVQIREAWGDSPPAWIVTLARACDSESQAAAARKIGRSGALVNQILKNKYKGSLNAVEARVNAVFDGDVRCPVLGLLDGAACFANQNAPYNPGNHVAVTLFTACRRCPFNLRNKEKRDAQ